MGEHAHQRVVDHFLLLQGLATKGLTQKDIDFRGVLTADAAASFAGGQFDCVGVFAPFTLQALERPGSHVVFSSKDFPGIIPDHIVVSQSMVAKKPKVAQKIVNAWYDTLDYIKANPDKATKIMADAASVSVADYQDFANGTKIFSVSGKVEQWVDREKRMLGPGDSAFLPAGTVHASFNVGDKDAKVVAILGPCVGAGGYELVDVASEAPWKDLWRL